MAFFDFIKAAGEKLFSTGSASAAPQSSGAGQSAADKSAAADAAAGDAILNYIKSQKPRCLTGH